MRQPSPFWTKADHHPARSVNLTTATAIIGLRAIGPMHLRRKTVMLNWQRISRPSQKLCRTGEDAILAELAEVQGMAADLGGYYRTNADQTAAVMRPSATLNAIID